MNKDNIGFKGEEYACNYLENKEYQIIARNFMCKSYFETKQERKQDFEELKYMEEHDE